MRQILNLEKLVTKYEIKIEGVIHIGAHFGEENRVYNKLGIKNRVFFEPQSSSFEELKRRLGSTHLLVNKALGNERKTVKMFIESANKGQSSSILKPTLHLVQYSNIKFDDIEEVEMIRLDDFGLNMDEFNFISIDVQGYELEVFKGASETLKSIDYIVSEINKEELYENGAKIEQLIEFLSPYGFELVEENWIGGNWGDGLFIKKK